jgi:hypothetical protein
MRHDGGRKSLEKPGKPPGNSNHVKNFTNFSCESGTLLLKHALKFAVGRTIFGSSLF